MSDASAFAVRTGTHSVTSDPDPATPEPASGGAGRAEASAERDRLAGKVNTADPEVAADVRQELMSHLKVLRGFALSLTRNGAAADDLVQDTVLKAWANLHSFEPQTNMRAWLFTILRNTFYSDRRKVAREVADSEGELADQLASKPDHDGHLNLRDFRVAFCELPVEQREVLILVGALGYAYDEAAEMCDVKIGTIKSRLNRGRERLAELMQIEDDETFEATDRATAAIVSEQGFKAI